MIHSIKFLEDWRCFKVNDTIDFRPGVNLLVGDQGTGKSSVLQALMASGRLKRHMYELDIAKKVQVKCDAGDIRAFDFEKDNLRTRHDFVDDIRTQVSLMFASHGQANMAIIKALSGFRDLVVLMDEPDMALSVRSINKLVQKFKEATNNDCQVIAAVHNPFLIWSFTEVYSLETRNWISNGEFIRSQVK